MRLGGWARTSLRLSRQLKSEAGEKSHPRRHGKILRGEWGKGMEH
jgi:hypothetical protein